MATNRKGATRVTPCQHKCKTPTPATLFVRWHPFKKDWEVRRCEHCGRDSAYSARG